jgi:hypothetical protein
MGNDLESFEDAEDFFSAIEIIKGCNIEKSREYGVWSPGLHDEITLNSWL